MAARESGGPGPRGEAARPEGRAGSEAPRVRRRLGAPPPPPPLPPHTPGSSLKRWENSSPGGDGEQAEASWSGPTESASRPRAGWRRGGRAIRCQPRRLRGRGSPPGSAGAPGRTAAPKFGASETESATDLRALPEASASAAPPHPQTSPRAPPSPTSPGRRRPHSASEWPASAERKAPPPSPSPPPPPPAAPRALLGQRKVILCAGAASPDGGDWFPLAASRGETAAREVTRRRLDSGRPADLWAAAPDPSGLPTWILRARSLQI
ncbi:collagen alpha-1(I) chain-like [Erinaceus europaeus]|uniref:Collagen alpha-1(I) chain-like n=1 Tax=Erinaceus europaeus TaxID=9365 RepID=A0ABM3XW83_ERIEU|nr:collagen alpha-1(I) chain-like [Erinaceus europaeus]